MSHFNILRFTARLLSPFVGIPSIRQIRSALTGYGPFLMEYLRYRRNSQEQVRLRDISPQLADRGSSSQSGRGEYFWQDIWGVDKVLAAKPEKHVDVGSRIDGFAAFLSRFMPVEYVDIRKADLGLPGFNEIEGSILALPYPDSTVSSISSLHVLEHIGLGRYGDPMDPDGSWKGIKELSRVLAKNGNLYLGIPIGQPRVEFNANRILDPVEVISFAEGCGLTCREFSAYERGKDRIIGNVNPADYKNAPYALGLFNFVKL